MIWFMRRRLSEFSPFVCNFAPLVWLQGQRGVAGDPRPPRVRTEVDGNDVNSNAKKKKKEKKKEQPTPPTQIRDL